MKKHFLLISFFTIVILGAWSCKKDTAAGCSAAWGAELYDEVVAMSNAAQAYSVSPTTENCLAYKSALQAYVNALEPYGNCATLTGTDRQAWQDALNDAQQTVDDIDCQ